MFCKLYKASIINAGNPLRLDENISFGEDLLFACAYMERAEKIVYARRGLYHYRENPDGAVRSAFREKKLSLLGAYRGISEIIERNNYNLKTEWECGFVYSSLILIVDMYLSGYRNKTHEKEVIGNIKKYRKSFKKSPDYGRKYKLYCTVLAVCPGILRLLFAMKGRKNK